MRLRSSVYFRLLSMPAYQSTMAQSGRVFAQSPRPQPVRYYPPPDGFSLPGTLNSVCYSAQSEDLNLNSMEPPSQEDRKAELVVGDLG